MTGASLPRPSVGGMVSAAHEDTFELAGHRVRRVGFGAMQLPGRGVMGPPRDHDEAIRVLRRAVEAGVNHIDTAEFYGPRVSNELIREALHPYPEDLLLVSKVGAERDDAGNFRPAQRPEQLRADVQENLRTLGADHLGAVNLRLLEDGDAEGRVPLADQLAEMVAMREEGLIEGVGISTAGLPEVEQAIQTAGLACVQNAFSLLAQDDEPVLARCAQAGVAYVPYFPLGSAFPGVPKVTEDERVRRVAERLGRSPAQVGLAWLLAHSPNVLLIPGTSSVAHLEDNLAVGEVELSDADLAELQS